LTGADVPPCKDLSPIANPPFDDYIVAASAALDMLVDPAWAPLINANLEVSLRLGNLVAEFPLPDEAEPAPVFKA
jgi:hypothetical protein